MAIYWLQYASTAISSASILISVFTLTAISADRYLLIVHPFQRPMTGLTCALAVLAIWLLSGVLIYPLLQNTEYLEIPISCEKNSKLFHHCQDSLWHPDWVRVVYGVGILISKTFIPFAIIAFCYSSISKTLTRMERRLGWRKASVRDLNEVRRKQNLQRILVVMVAVFAACSLPWDILNLISDIDWMLMDRNLISPEVAPALTIVTHFVAMTATLWNPILYAFWNENFKREFYALCGRRRKLNTVEFQKLASIS